MKVDNDVDVLSEGDPIAVNTDEGYIPSAFSVMKAKSEVSNYFEIMFVVVVHVSVYVFKHMYVSYM
jgi:hypothetical protein